MDNYWLGDWNYCGQSSSGGPHSSSGGTKPIEGGNAYGIYYGQSSAGGPHSSSVGTKPIEEGNAYGDQIYASRNKNDNRKIFVGGLSLESTSDDLREYFQQFGEIVDVNLKSDPISKTSRGFGFVLFKDAVGVDKTIAHRHHVLHGRTIDPKRAMAENSRELSSKIFVGGIDPNTTKEEITETFSKFGKIIQIELPYDILKNERRAFGFITFESEEVADNVCLNHKVNLGKRKVDVKKMCTKEHLSKRCHHGHTREGYVAPAAAAAAAATVQQPRGAFAGRGRGQGSVDPTVYQTNGMFKSGCADEDDDDDLSTLEGAYNVISAMASSLNLPDFSSNIYRPPYQPQQRSRGSTGRGGNGRGRRGYSPGSGFHPYNR